MANKVIDQLKVIAKANNYDVIELFSTFNGRPVYCLRRSGLPPRAKTGYPYLLSVTATGSVFELDCDQIHKVLVSRNAKAE